MTSRPLRILLIGGDTSVWVGLSTALGVQSSQIFVPNDIDMSSLKDADPTIDVFVVVTSAGDPDPCSPIRKLSEAGLQAKTLVLANGNDRRTAAEVLALGVAGYVQRGSGIKDVADAMVRVANGSVVLDAPAAAIFHARGERTAGDTASSMSAARALASALELKDTYTGGHAERVTALAHRLALAVDHPDAIPSESLEAAFLLHDVGKIGIPESILNKPGGLTDTERRVLNTHPILGERIVAPLAFPDCVRQVIRHHHERWDGLGYPDRLSGEEIPIAARIFAIADVIDAMTSIRPYRRPVTFEEAIAEIIRHGGTQFDPMLAAIAEETFLDTPLQLLDSNAWGDL